MDMEELGYFLFMEQAEEQQRAANSRSWDEEAYTAGDEPDQTGQGESSL